MFKGFQIAASGMQAQRTRLNVVSSNLANASTTRTEEGGPYKRQRPIFVAAPLDGAQPADNSPEGSLRAVAVQSVERDETEGAMVYDPEHPDADSDGYLRMPNVNMVEEMVDMMTAARSFEANVQAFQTLKEMTQRSMDIGR